MVDVDVDDCAMAMFRFKNGALGTLEATRFASGRKNYLDFEISGTKGAIAFNWERSTELLYCSAADRADVQGFRTIVTGPLQPGGESFWPIPGIGTAYIETQVAQLGDFVRAVRDGGHVDTDFAHGCKIQEVMEAMLASAADRRWHPVESAVGESRAA
jgi:predicted dehydrogenase